MAGEPAFNPNETDGLPLFDLRESLKRLGDDPSLFRDVVGFFHADSPRILAEVRAGLAASEARQVERAAHTLKGMAATFDAKRAVAAAASVESLAKAGDLDGASRALQPLESEIAALSAALRSDEAR